MRENQANNESKLRRAKKLIAKLAEYDSIEKHGMTDEERERFRNPFAWRDHQTAAQNARIKLQEERRKHE